MPWELAGVRLSWLKLTGVWLALLKLARVKKVIINVRYFIVYILYTI
jgi:hypothetical protein